MFHVGFVYRQCRERIACVPDCVGVWFVRFTLLLCTVNVGNALHALRIA